MKKLKKLFVASGKRESVPITLDNSEVVKLVRVGVKDDVVVENEHGTYFSMKELSEKAIDTFVLQLAG